MTKKIRRIKDLPPNVSLLNVAFRHPITKETCYWKSQWGYMEGKAGIFYAIDIQSTRRFTIHLDGLLEVLEFELAE